MTLSYKMIGRRIKEYRIKAAMSQDELAQKIGISTPFMNRLENGQRNITLENLAKISVILNVSIEYLIAGTVLDKKEEASSEFARLTKSCDESTTELLLNICKDILTRFHSYHKSTDQNDTIRIE